MNYRRSDESPLRAEQLQRSNKPELNVPTREEIDVLFQLCRSDEWHAVLEQVQQKPWIATTQMAMDNHITTTIVHQAITSKGNTAIRAEVISTILNATPQTAAIKNGYGSLPLHVICQRNTKIDAQTKERLVFQMVPCYPAALTEQGGVGKRTPLHIIFTGTSNIRQREWCICPMHPSNRRTSSCPHKDYISPRMTRMMIDNGSQACFMKDKKGLLPAHVACMRHCSPDKLRMLLAVNPGALVEPTNAGETLLILATKSATKAHPNYALIDELNRQLAGVSVEPESEIVSPQPVHYQRDMRPMPPPSYRHYYFDHNEHSHYQSQQQVPQSYHQPYHAQPLYQTRHTVASAVGRVSSEDEESWNRVRLNSNDSNSSWTGGPYAQAPVDYGEAYSMISPTPNRTSKQQAIFSSPRPSRKRKAKTNPDRGVDLLLHFSRKSNRDGSDVGHGIQDDPASPPEHEPAAVDWGEIRGGLESRLAEQDRTAEV
jgi:hypothetical protein